MTILAAVGEQRQPVEIIERGFELATAFEEELHVLHVIPEQDAEEHFNAIRSIDEFRDMSFSVEIDRAENIAQELIDGALGEAAVSTVTPVGRIGDPAEEISAAIDALDPRYVVVGGRKRSPLGKVAFGSVTQSVILDSGCPVVTVIAEE
ncbi:MAG: universal stress protein [Haloarculaceae archaeon]